MRIVMQKFITMTSKLKLPVESRMQGDLQVRFGGRSEKTYRRKAARRPVPSLRTGDGGSIIDLVVRMENCSVTEAARRLMTGSHGTAVSRPDTPWSSGALQSPRLVVRSDRELLHPALLGYLSERGIDLAIARTYCREVRYAIGNKHYFAIGFRNDAGGWELRNARFKGASTPKHITSIDNGSHTAILFEGFMDFLSYLSLKKAPHLSVDSLVLNSVVNLPKALPFLARHELVHAFLDNDETGRKALSRLADALPASEVIDRSGFYRPHKDLNDY